MKTINRQSKVNEISTLQFLSCLRLSSSKVLVIEIKLGIFFQFVGHGEGHIEILVVQLSSSILIHWSGDRRCPIVNEM